MSVYSDSEYLQTRPLDDKWLLNRGKIAFPDFEQTENFNMQGIFWYPNQGYREWHSNYDYKAFMPSLEVRMYFLDVLEPEKSHFYYLDKDNCLQAIPDKPNMVNVFFFPAFQKFWHSVVSHTDRFSMGMAPKNKREIDRIADMLDSISEPSVDSDV